MTGVWEPSYALDVHMDVSLPCYHTSCSPPCFGIPFPWILTGCLPGVKQPCSTLIEASDPFKIVPTSTPNIWHVFGDLHVLRMCIWMCPFHVAIAPVLHALENCPRIFGVYQVINNHVAPWLRLQTHSRRFPHPLQTYERCLATFICCGCAYGCVHTMLW